MMQWVPNLLLVLHLIHAVRIDVKECPLDKTAWEAREQAYVHECKSPEVYHCIQDDRNILMETCKIPDLVDPARQSGCPWALYTDSGRTVIGGAFNPCSGQGCPKKDDPEYWTNQLYKYPKCLHHYVRTTIKTTEALTYKTLNVIKSAFESPEIHQGRYESTDHSYSIIGALIGITGVGVIVMAIWYYRKRRKSAAQYNALSERDILLQNDRNSSPSDPSVVFNEDETLPKPIQKKVVARNSTDTYQTKKSDFSKSEEDKFSTELQSLCRKGDFFKVKHLIHKTKKGLSIKGKTNRYLLHNAGISGSVDLVEFLIKYGYDMKTKDDSGRTVVHIACENTHLNLVKYLVYTDKGVLNIKDKDGMTPFHCAGFSRSVELVQYLIENGCDVYSKSYTGRTIVHNACEKGHVDLMKHLVFKDKGILNVKDNNGMTPFLCAGVSGSVELIQYLIDNGCDVNSKDNVNKSILHHACQGGHVNLVKHLIDTNKCKYKDKDKNGMELIHNAGLSGSIGLLQYLIDNGCDVHSKDNGGRTIVHHACQVGHIELVKYLIDKYKCVLNMKDINGLTPFHCTGLSGSVELVQYLIDNGCDVCSKDNGGRTIAHHACQVGHIKLVKHLIHKYKCVLNIKDKNGLTPFHFAGFSGSVELVWYLISSGCYLYSKDNIGRTIVSYACQSGQVNLVKYLIDKDETVLKINEMYGLRPFHCAGFSGSIELVQYLIDNGCDVYSKDNTGRTIVHYACQEGHVNLVKHLIEKNKGVSEMNDKNGLTPFHFVGFSGSVELVQYLIDNGCEVYSRDFSFRTIVHHACQNGNVSMVKHLIDKDIDVLNTRDNNGLTPFHCAGFSGSVELVQCLIDKGCDVYSTDNGGRTLLHNACQGGHVNLMKHLVKHLKDKGKGVINIRDNCGFIPFHCIGFTGSVELVQYLIDNGCDMYSTSNTGRTIVHHACHKGHVNLVKHIVNRDKAVLDIKDNNESTPFHCAGLSGSVELVQYLIDNGCDVFSRDNDGRTIVHYACYQGHVNLVKHLININTDLLKIKDNDGLALVDYTGFSRSFDLKDFVKNIVSEG